MNNCLNNPSMSSCGYLELFIGPMWSGKTTELVNLYTHYTYCGNKVLAINHVNDTRYGSDTISTHDLVKIPCESVGELRSISDITKGILTSKFKEAEVILINEGQFFKDIVEWVKTAVETNNKHVYICGLDGDFKRETFGDILSLIPFCDRVTKKHSVCGCCKSRYAIFTHRNSKEQEQELIGAKQYVSLCRKCYNEKTMFYKTI